MGIPIGIQFRVIEKLEVKAIQDAVEKGNFKSLQHAAAAIRRGIVDSMPQAKGPSQPGSPPHRHRGRLVRSVVYDVEKSIGTAVIGPSYDRMESGGYPPWMASMHERGGTFAAKGNRNKKKGKQTRTYPARPFMAPAIQRALPRMAGFFANTITP